VGFTTSIGMPIGSALRLLLVAVVLFGGAWPITKAALADATPLWFGTSRAGLAALVAALLLAALGRLSAGRGGRTGGRPCCSSACSSSAASSR
jgi:drug/metabolite transporter (DMT)-like permease